MLQPRRRPGLRRSFRLNLAARGGFLLLLWLLLAIAPVAQAELIPIAGDSDNLWVVDTADSSRAVVLHRRATDPPSTFRPVVESAGRVRPFNIAAVNDHAWVAYEGVSLLQSLAFIGKPEPGFAPYREPEVTPPLPPVAAVLSLAASPECLWALVRVEDPEVLEQIDAGISRSAATTTFAPPPPNAFPWDPFVPILVPLPTSMPATLPATAPAATRPTTTQPAASQPAATRAADVPEIDPVDPEPTETAAGEPISAPERATAASRPAAGAVQSLATAPAATRPAASRPATHAAIAPTFRLLCLGRGGWVNVPLPEPWPSDMRQAWALQLRPDDAAPTLVCVRQGDASADVRVYQRRDGAWASRSFELPARGELVPVTVDSQLVLAASEPTPEGLTVRLWAVDAGQLRPVGSLPLPTGATSWGAGPLGHGVSLVARDATGALNWALLDLQGGERSIMRPWAPVVLSQPVPIYLTPGAVLQIVALILAFLLMVTFWRRDAEAITAKLPEGFVAADLLRRALAAAIDLAPCLVLAAWSQGVSPRAIQEHWPYAGAQWEEMRAGLIAIGLFSLYGLFAEMFWARTVGKWVMGLRVTSLDGTPPNLWQVIARNLLKCLDMVSLPLLILAFIRPHGQRLGDLVARTVVIQPGEDEEESPPVDEP